MTMVKRALLIFFIIIAGFLGIDTNPVIGSHCTDCTPKPPMRDDRCLTSRPGTPERPKHQGYDVRTKNSSDKNVYSVYCGHVDRVKNEPAVVKDGKIVKHGAGNYIVIRSCNGCEVKYFHLKLSGDTILIS